MFAEAQGQSQKARHAYSIKYIPMLLQTLCCSLQVIKLPMPIHLYMPESCNYDQAAGYIVATFVIINDES